MLQTMQQKHPKKRNAYLHIHFFKQKKSNGGLRKMTQKTPYLEHVAFGKNNTDQKYTHKIKKNTTNKKNIVCRAFFSKKMQVRIPVWCCSVVTSDCKDFFLPQNLT